MVLSSLGYVFYILQLLVLNDALLYTSSVILGLASALYWTAQVRLSLSLSLCPALHIFCHSWPSICSLLDSSG